MAVPKHPIKIILPILNKSCPLARFPYSNNDFIIAPLFPS